MSTACERLPLRRLFPTFIERALRNTEPPEPLRLALPAGANGPANGRPLLQRTAIPTCGAATVCRTTTIVTTPTAR